MPIMEILIEPDGNVVVDIQNSSGSGCRNFSKSIEEALGNIITSSKKKPEFYCASNETCVDTNI
jgi:hypothetical protein